MTELTQLNVTIADWHDIITEWHGVIDSLDAAVAGFTETASNAVIDRDKDTRERVAANVREINADLNNQITRARHILTRLTEAQATGHVGAIDTAPGSLAATAHYHDPNLRHGSTHLAGATVTAAVDDAELEHADHREKLSPPEDKQAPLSRTPIAEDKAGGDKATPSDKPGDKK